MNVNNHFLVLFFSFVISQCSAVNEKEMTLLKGYWEIEYVQAHGEKFQPRGNAPAVDYYFLTSDSTGVKKKLSPRIVGFYETSENQVRFRVEHDNGHFYLHFTTPLEEWKEEIKDISNDQLVLFHNEMEYHYKRHEKIAL